MPNRMGPGCNCCGSECNTTLTVCVKCGFTNKPNIAVSAKLDGVEVDSCTTASNGCCALSLTDPGEHSVFAAGAVKVVTPNCSTQAVTFQGETCATCTASQTTLTLQTPYGDVTLEKDVFGTSFIGFGTVPDVPDVLGLDCSDPAVACTGTGAVRDVVVQYTLACVLNSWVITMRPLACQNPFTLEWHFVSVTVSGTECNDFLFYTDQIGYDEDGFSYDGCVPCNEDLQFALDYTGLAGSPAVVTVTGFV